MSDSTPRIFRRGDLFPDDLVTEATCPARGPKFTFQAFCVFEKGYNGQHVAIDPDGEVMEAWD